MSDQHTIPELRAALSSSQVLLDEAAGAEGCPDLLPDWRDQPSATFGVDADASSEFIDLTDLLDVWKKYLDEKARVRLEFSFEELVPGVMASDHVPELDLQAALQKCQAAAETGYQKALAHVTALGTIAGQTEAQANRLGGAAMSADEAEFKRQIDEVVQTLEDECSRLRHDIDDKRNRLNTFNLTLFGRTMTGKSTLMEILTRGDGSSIGKGRQRTTRDVRAYEWNRLTVVDVPGVAAYGGDGDSETAHQAANQADLVLFLISDDGPQMGEAEHLARLRRQGKSVLGIFNVKEQLGTSDESIRFFLRENNREKLFKAADLQAISAQFDELVGRHLPGQKIELVNAHLHARYLAGLPEHENKPWRNDLERFSRFQDVENRILHEVAANGPFLRTHSFLNIAAVANLQGWESARKSAELCDTAQGRLKGRLEELRSWQTGFIRKANQGIDRLIQQTAGTLRNEIPSFSDQHCEDRSLADKWNARVGNAGIDEKCQALQKQLADECQNYFKQLVADSQQELALLDHQFRTVGITTGTITDTRRRWNWGVSFAGSALGGITTGLFLSGVTMGWNPLGWALLGAGAIVAIAGLVGSFFKSRDNKRREAIAKITPHLFQNVDGIERQVRSRMKEWLENFTEQHVNRAEAQFSQLVESQEGMANFMRDIADRQRKSLLAVNWDTAAGALRHLEEFDAVQLVHRVARIPGQAVVLATVGTSSKLSADAVARLESLLQEKVVNVPEWMSGSGMRSVLKSFDKETSERLVAQLT